MVSLAAPSLLDELDVVTLEGVLADIDACQFDVCAVLDDAPSSDESERKPRDEPSSDDESERKPRVVPYAQRYDVARRLEVRKLRSQASELQATIEQARRRGGAFVRSHWFRIANEQRRLRAQAELEREQLRSLVANFWDSTTKIERLMERVECMRNVLPRGLSMAADFRAFRGPVIDPANQFKRLDGLALNANKIFTTGAFADERRRSFQEVQFFGCLPGQQSMEIEFSTAWELPFPVEIVSDAFWRQIEQHVSKKKKRLASVIVYGDAKSNLSQFMAQTGAACNNHGRISSRRYPNADPEKGVLIVSNLALHAFSDDRLSGCVEGDSWIRVVHVPSTAGPRSRVQWYGRARLQPGASSQPQHGKWIQGIVTSVNNKRERKVEKTIRALENLAIDETVARKKRSQGKSGSP